VLRIARKRENTETDGTGFGIAAAVEEAGTAAVVVACDGLVEGMAIRGEELFSGEAARREVDAEFCVTSVAEAKLASGRSLRDAAEAGGGEEESGAEAASPFAVENTEAGAVSSRRTATTEPEFCSAG
jgi:hypothetical protein